MSLRIVVLTLLVACSGSAANAPVPDPNDTPPTTKDPGATEDRSAMPPTPIGPEARSGSGAAKKADGASCAGSAECASGVCEGEGCDERRLGRCMPRDRACTKDLREYCGCDGITFRASGSCPGQRFRAPRDCKAP
ncbi:MAG: hypothetical protein AB7P03_02370 [Kofleriaceae bacterium]